MNKDVECHINMIYGVLVVVMGAVFNCFSIALNDGEMGVYVSEYHVFSGWKELLLSDFIPVGIGGSYLLSIGDVFIFLGFVIFILGFVQLVRLKWVVN